MTQVKIGNYFEIGTGKLALLSGPCVIENRDLCLKTAEFLKGVCDHLQCIYYILHLVFIQVFHFTLLHIASLKKAALPAGNTAIMIVVYFFVSVATVPVA